MLLYHGTNGRWLKNILRVGIEPRHGHPARNNWSHVKHQSNSRCVYLTNSYAPYFAMNAARGSGAECAVVEIDTDKLDVANLFPDEDFLEQVTRARDGQASGDMSTRTLFYRSRQFEFSGPCEIGGGGISTWWEQSLLHLGTCSHRGTIPPSAITRACRWPHKPNALLRFIWDPSIVIMNQRIMGPQYVALTRKLFAGDFTDPRSVTIDDRMAAMTDPEKAILPPINGWEIITPMTTRAEHIAWARERALAYLPDDTGQAVASMVSDLTKHPETAGIAFEEGQKMMPVLLDETSPPIQDVEKVRAWIEAIR